MCQSSRTNRPQGLRSRTGAAKEASFFTGEGSAKAGSDFVSARGRLRFAPLEVVKIVEVPLISRTGVTERLHFNMNLANPSAGYDAVPTTPVRLSHDPPRPRLLYGRPWRSPNGWLVGSLKCVNAVPGMKYLLESSTNWKTWEGQWVYTAEGPASSVGSFQLDPHLPRFLRVKALGEAPAMLEPSED